MKSTRSLSNPYTNRAAIFRPDDFFGRIQELQDIYTRLNGGQSVLVVGERRIGKSSLLNAIGFEREQFGMEDVHFIFLDMQSMAGCSEESFITDLMSLITRETLVSTSKTGRAGLEGIGEELRKENRRLIISIDEFDVLVSNEKISTEFLVFLRFWTVSYQIPLVVAFREGAIDRIVQDEKYGSAFLNLFGSVYVGPLHEDEAVDLVRGPAELRGVLFTEEEVETALDLAGFYPLELQIACYHLFEMKRVGKSLDTGGSMVKQRFRFEAVPHFEYMWKRLTIPERSALQLWVTRGTSVNPSVEEELLRKGILIRERRATRLCSSVLEELVRQWETDAAPVGSVRDALLR